MIELGNKVKDPNVRLRLLLFFFIGVIAFGSVLYWRSQALVAAEYQDIAAPHRISDQVKMQTNLESDTH